MDEHDWLARQFEANRAHLRAVAYRVLGSPSEADDAVQEAWLHLSRSDTSAIQNLSGWLTTVVARVCLDMLRARAARREEPLGEIASARVPEAGSSREGAIDPEQEALLSEAVGLALLVVLDILNPAERLAFVLHDLFDVPFDQIAPIVGRSPASARQLASRARRRVRGQRAERDAAATPNIARMRQRSVVSAFLAAARGGDFAALLALLDPDVTLRADGAAVAAGAASDVHGARAVAEQFAGRARVARLALINGAVGAVWAAGGRPRVAFRFTVTEEKIVAIEILSGPERLSQLELVMLNE